MSPEGRRKKTVKLLEKLVSGAPYGWSSGLEQTSALSEGDDPPFLSSTESVWHRWPTCDVTAFTFYQGLQWDTPTPCKDGGLLEFERQLLSDRVKPQEAH